MGWGNVQPTAQEDLHLNLSCCKEGRQQGDLFTDELFKLELMMSPF